MLGEANATFLLGANDERAVVERAVQILPFKREFLLALSAQGKRNELPSTPDLIKKQLESRGANVELLIAPTSNLAAWLKMPASLWAPVDLGGRGSRLTHAAMPAALANSNDRQVLLWNDLTRFDPRRPAIAIAVWSRFAHPRQRFGASLGAQSEGLVAEIAIAAPAAWYLLAGSWRGKPLLIVSNDMIATELTGLAIGELQADPDDQRSGPWENPLVQRAAELSLGVRLPSQIHFTTEWMGNDEQFATGFLAFGTEVSARLGIPASSVS